MFNLSSTIFYVNTARDAFEVIKFAFSKILIVQ
jgi:hypothetical protein